MAVGNLEFIKSETITTSVSSIDITDCFSDKYNVYQITVAGINTAGAAGASLDMRLIDSVGSVISASEYDWAYLDMSSGLSFVETRSTNSTDIRRITAISNDGGNAVAYIFNPYDSSSYTFVKSQGVVEEATSGYMEGYKQIGVHKSAETITGFQLFEGNGARPFDEGKISVYGLASN